MRVILVVTCKLFALGKLPSSDVDPYKRSGVTIRGDGD